MRGPVGQQIASLLTAVPTTLSLISIPKHVSPAEILHGCFSAVVMFPLQHSEFHLCACVLCHRMFFHHCVPAECNSPCQSISLKKNPAGREFHFFGLSPT